VQLKSNPQPPRFWLIAISAVIAVSWLLFVVSDISLISRMHSAAHSQEMTASSELPQSDFARFWFVGKSLSMGAKTPSAWFEKSFRIDILSPASGTRAWLYPPTMNLVAMVFAQLPLALSFWVWRLFCWIIAGFLLRIAGLPWIVIIAGLLSPAGLLDTLGGQNGTLIGALMASALLLIDQHPRIGGTIAGILCINFTAPAPNGILCMRYRGDGPGRPIVSRARSKALDLVFNRVADCFPRNSANLIQQMVSSCRLHCIYDGP
jgi:hypothetical protein